MPSEILIQFDLTKPGASKHGVRNFGEDLDREVVRDRFATTSTDEIDKTASEILVQIPSAKANGRTIAMIKKLLKHHALTEAATIVVNGKRVDARLISDV
jgi:hypothetical protein